MKTSREKAEEFVRHCFMPAGTEEIAFGQELRCIRNAVKALLEQDRAEQREACGKALYEQIKKLPDSPTDLLLDAVSNAGIEE